MTDEQIIALVRNFLGGLTEEEAPDSTILFFWNKWKLSLSTDIYPERIPVAIYNTVIDCVRWLIAQEIASGNSSVTERLEKIGDETISIKGGSTLKSWKDFLDWLLLNPDYIDPSLGFNSSLVIIGGVRKDQVLSIKRNPNSFNGYMEQGVFPSRAIPRNADGRLYGDRCSPWMVR